MVKSKSLLGPITWCTKEEEDALFHSIIFDSTPHTYRVCSMRIRSSPGKVTSPATVKSASLNESTMLTHSLISPSLPFPPNQSIRELREGSEESSARLTASQRRRPISFVPNRPHWSFFLLLFSLHSLPPMVFRLQRARHDILVLFAFSGIRVGFAGRYECAELIDCAEEG